MKKIVMLVAAVMLALTLNAGVQTYTQPIPKTQLSFQSSLVLPAFNENLGILQSTSGNIVLTNEFIFVVYNTSRGMGEFMLDLELMVNINENVNAVDVLEQYSFQLPGVNQLNDYPWVDTEWVTVGGRTVLAATTNYTYTTVFGDTMNYTGAGPFVVNYGMTPHVEATAPGNAIVQTVGYGYGYAQVNYTYECYGTGTIGFWKNHPESWPVDALEIGGEVLNQTELIAILSSPVGQSKWLIAAKQLIAAKLNVLSCGDNCVDLSVEVVDQWLKDGADMSQWKSIEKCVNELTNYNEGKLCRNHR